VDALLRRWSITVNAQLITLPLVLIAAFPSPVLQADTDANNRVKHGVFITLLTVIRPHPRAPSIDITDVVARRVEDATVWPDPVLVADTSSTSVEM
jgi:hypothetical protein